MGSGLLSPAFGLKKRLPAEPTVAVGDPLPGEDTISAGGIISGYTDSVGIPRGRGEVYGPSSFFPIRSYSVRNGSQGFRQDPLWKPSLDPRDSSAPPPHSKGGFHTGSVIAKVVSRQLSSNRPTGTLSASAS